MYCMRTCKSHVIFGIYSVIFNSHILKWDIIIICTEMLLHDVSIESHFNHILSNVFSVLHVNALILHRRFTPVITMTECEMLQTVLVLFNKISFWSIFHSWMYSFWSFSKGWLHFWSANSFHLNAMPCVMDKRLIVFMGTAEK